MNLSVLAYYFFVVSLRKDCLVMAKDFYVILPCKPYVKRYIEQNFGNPADFSSNKILQHELVRSLKKPNKRLDSRLDYINAVSNYKSKIDMIISEDMFYRHGWMLSVTDVVNINKIIESLVKGFMTTMVGLSVANGYPIKDSIIDFQDRNNYPEEIWAYESIAKEFQRHGKKIVRTYQIEISRINQKLFMECLSLKRTNVTNKISI